MFDDFLVVPPLHVRPYDRVLTFEALEFLHDITTTFEQRIIDLLKARKSQTLDFLPVDRSVWQVAPPPHDLIDRRVEITGPPDRKMVINALNSGANVFMADFEDSCSPTWDNLMSGQLNLMDAVRRTIELVVPHVGKYYKLNDNPAVLMVRPRGLHMPERHFELNGEPVHGALIDFGLYFFHNVHELISHGTGAYFYLPKLESHLEARLWNDVFIWAENRLNVPRGTIRATVLIETLPAAFQMDAILYELRDHSVGLNCGRWDYIFSFIKKQANEAMVVLSDRSALTMDKGFLALYSRLLIQTCHHRGAHAMGGMSAQIPIKNDPEANSTAMAKVKVDKEREASLGHDGTWVAHPALIPIAKEAFKDYVPGQFTTMFWVVPMWEEMLDSGPYKGTDGCLRHNIRVSVQYIEAWLNGSGCVPLYNLMEDAATAEISRAQVWQWLRHKAWVGDYWLTKERLISTIDEETKQFVGGRFQEAKKLFTELVVSPKFEDFLTIPAYELL